MSPFPRASAANTKIVLNTTSKLASYTVHWAINNFSFILKNTGDFISSPSFYTNGNTNEWNIQLYPNGSLQKEGYICLFLFNLSQVDLTVQATFSVLNNHKIRCHSKTFIYNIKSLSDYGFKGFLKREQLLGNNYLPDDTLTIVCEIKVLEDSDQLYSHSKQSDLEKLSEDLKQQYINSLHELDFSDLTISVGDKTFSVHKFILAARSPVFAAMFKHEMTESKSNNVQISDIDPRVMEQVLLYMYSAQCPGINEMAAEILQVSDKYDIAGLKELCEKTLFDQLTTENATKTLITSYLHNCKSLEEKTLSFIIKHSKKVLNSCEWNDMLTAHPALGLKSLRVVVHQFIKTD